MSIEALRWALDAGQEHGLTPTQRHILLMLGNRADEAGHLYPSVDWICERTGHNRRTVQRTMKQLSDLRLLRRATRLDEGGAQTSNAIWLAMVQPGLPLGEEGQLDRGGRHSAALPPAAVRRPPGGRVPPNTQEVKQEKTLPTGASPVGAAFKDYAEGIHRRYRVNYPPSAQANGILAGLVRELGAEGARATIRHYLTRTDEFYVRNRHSLKLLKRDAGALYIQAQESGGSSGRRRCAYCEAPAIGRTGSIDHCRAHTNDALDQKPVPERQAA